MRRSSWLSVGFVLSAVLGTWLLFGAPGLSGLAGKDPVMVFLVRDPAVVAAIHRAAAPDRVLYATPGAVVLGEDRIVAVDVEAAEAPVNTLGWVDREIEIITLEVSPRANSASSEARSQDDPERRARLTELMRKDTLSYGEQMFLLKAMNDGVVF